MNIEEKIKLFGMSQLMVERDLDRLETELNLDLGRDVGQSDDHDDSYYPQFPESVRRQASEMSKHYELFFSLEQSIRALVSERLISEDGAAWWDTSVPSSVKENVKKNMSTRAGIRCHTAVYS